MGFHVKSHDLNFFSKESGYFLGRFLILTRLFNLFWTLFLNFPKNLSIFTISFTFI